MASSTINLTRFEVRKLRCIGGEGRATPYRITTYRGMELGEVCQISDFEDLAANSSVVDPTGKQRALSALHRISTRLSQRLERWA